MRLATLLLTCAFIGAGATAAAAQATTDPTAAFGNLWAYAGALATSAALGGVKTLDTRLTNATWFRKLQPAITLAGAFGAAALASHGGPPIDPSAFASAPLATVATVTAVELLSLFRKKKS